MAHISKLFTDDHGSCDEALAAVEEAAQANAWDQTASLFRAFTTALERHFSAEENILFPAFERATGMAGGPPAVMRMEHQQMRGLLGQMNQAVTQRDAGAFLGASETLLVLMQQHNMKEEHILYPMCDQHLANQADTLAALEKSLQ